MKKIHYLLYGLMVVMMLAVAGCEKDDTDFSDYFNKTTTEEISKADDDATDETEDKSDENDGEETGESGESGEDESGDTGNEGTEDEKTGSEESGDNQGNNDDSTGESDASANIDPSSVNVVYSGSSAQVTIADDVKNYLTVSVSGAQVSIVQSSSLSTEVTYTLSGSSSNGMFYMDGDLKATLVLNGLTLTNSNGPAVNIENGKRIAVVLTDGTVNTLTDSSSGSHKAAFMVNGHTEFEGGGTLNLTGSLSHAFWGDEYVVFKKSLGTINVLSAQKDGFNVNQYIEMNGGVITVKNVEDDGLQVSLEGDGSAEDTGALTIQAGTLNVSATGKGLKAEGDVAVSGGYVTVTSSGGEGIESEGAVDITGGVITVNSYDDGINSGGDLTVSGGSLFVRSSNNDGMDANGNCYIKGGLVYAIGASQPEVAIDANSEERKQLYVTGGTLIAIGGLESGASLSQTCYSTSSWSKSTWYSLTYGSTVFAFKTPSSGGTAMVVSASSTPTLKSGVSVSGGTSIFGGMGYTGATVSGGSSVSLSQYNGSGGNTGGNPGGGNPGGPGGRG